MSAVVVPTRVTLCMLWKGYKNFKHFKILVATLSNSPSKSGRSITRMDLVAYRKELVLMSWDVVRSWRLVKWDKLSTCCYVIQDDFSELLRHLASLLRHSYEYPRVSTIYMVGMSCRTRRTL